MPAMRPLHPLPAMLLALAVGALPATAAPSMTLIKGGPEIKLVQNAGLSGILYGVRAVRHLDFFLPVYFGGMAYGALPTKIGEGLAPAFGYAGVLVGGEGRLYKGTSDKAGYLGRDLSWLGLDANLHVGMTHDFRPKEVSYVADNLCFEPSLSVGVPLPYITGARLAAGVGYLYMPFAHQFSGFTLALRYEAKAIETLTAIDD